MTASALPDLITWVDQQLENQRHTARVLKTLAASEPPETAAFITEIADTLAADAYAKRRILDEHNDPVSDGRTLRPGGEQLVCGTCHEFGLRSEHQPWPCATLRLMALPFAHLPGYRAEWKPA